MQRIVKCDEKDYSALLAIWERAVRATHDFLAENDLNEIKSILIPDYFPKVDIYAVVVSNTLAGFIGLSSDTIEMLFIDDYCRNKGYGSVLVDFAKQRGISKVDVNEQNLAALKFYEARGFRVISWDDTDDDGRLYPILHLSL